MSENHFAQYANGIYREALELIPQNNAVKGNILFEPILGDEVIAKIEFSNPRKIKYSYGCSMLIYRIVRLALASNPLFYSNTYTHKVLQKRDARIILREIIINLLEDKQGGLHYPVSPQVVRMSEVLTKEANLFFVLHEICHCIIIDDEFNSFMPSLLWGTPTKIPEITDPQLLHEILADRLASIFKFQNILTEKKEDYYIDLMKARPDIFEGQTIQQIVKQDLGMKLIGVECALFTQLILEKFERKNPNYLDFDNRVNWNRKFIFDMFGLSKDIFYLPEVIIGFLIELLDEIDINYEK